MRRSKKGISLVVPVKDDSEALGYLLHSLENQTQLPNEVILVVSQSSDATLAVAQLWRPEKIKANVIYDPSANRSWARNIGVEHASGDVIVFTDAGCLPESNWLEKLTEPFSDPSTQLVSGFTEGSWSTSLEEAQVPFVLVPLAKIEEKPLPATRNMAVRRSVFLESGGFRPDLNFAEDFELARRLRAKGIRANFVPDAVVHWRPRQSLLSFFRMISNLTHGDIQAGILRPGMWSIWLRYFLFFIFLSFPPLGLIIFMTYLVIKVRRFQFSQRQTYFIAAVLQVVSDFAVLGGSMLGLLERIFLAFQQGKLENRTHAD